MTFRLERKYILLTAVYVAAIYWLSSIPDYGEGHPLVLLASNLAHAPLFAGLAFCVWRSLGGHSEGVWERYGLTLLVTGTCALIDEWYQASVPGRHASIGDLAVDLAGITAMLLFLALRTRSENRRCEAK